MILTEYRKLLHAYSEDTNLGRQQNNKHKTLFTQRSLALATFKVKTKGTTTHIIELKNAEITFGPPILSNS